MATVVGDRAGSHAAPTAVMLIPDSRFLNLRLPKIAEHCLGETGEITQPMLHNRNQDRQIQSLIGVNGDVAKTDHALHVVREFGGQKGGVGEQFKAVAGALGYAKLLLANDIIRQINRLFTARCRLRMTESCLV